MSSKNAFILDRAEILTSGCGSIPYSVINIHEECRLNSYRKCDYLYINII